MTRTEMIEQKHQEDLQRLRGFRLMDDDFFTKCFDGNTDCVALVLQIVLDKPDLQVDDVLSCIELSDWMCLLQTAQAESVPDTTAVC